MYEISVIIPVFNTEKYLADCLDSVCASTVFPLCQVLVIDDGSLDGSLEIAGEYGRRYENISVYRTFHSGVSAARNRGIQKARGRYLFFLDSDDRVEKEYLQKLYEAIEENDCDMACAGFSRVKEGGNPVPAVKSILSPGGVTSGCEYLERRMDAGDWDNQIWCNLYRKAFLKEHGLTFCEDIHLYEDILFTNRALLYASKIRTVPEYGYVYRQRKGSLVQSGLSDQDVENALLVLERFRKEYENYDKRQKHAAGRVYFQIVSMILYCIGALHSTKKKEYYRRLSRLKLWKPLLGSISSKKEAVKWVIFRIGWGLYYPFCR